MPYSKHCPYCGEVLRPDDATRSVRCDACGAQTAPGELRVQTEEELMKLLNDPPKKTADRDGFLCDNCGAQLIADESAASAFCCFCGAPALKPERIRHALEPELILPFAVDRREAQSRFVHWFGAKKLISPGFLDTAKAGRISGAYVPILLFDAALETHLHAVSSSTETERNDRSETVTARRFCHYRCVTGNYTAVAATASERFDEQLTALLGPFDLNRLEPFDPSAAEGFFREKNGFTPEQAFARVREQLEAEALRAARDALNTERYAEVKSCRHIYTALDAKLALLPVWLLNHNEAGCAYRFLMNGQTGKIVGDAPLSLTRTLQWFAGVTAGVAAAGELLWFAVDHFLK